MTMKRTIELLPLMNFFAEMLRETLDEWEVSQAEVSRMTGIPSPHLTDMKKSRRRCTPEKRRRLVAVLDRSERDVLRRSEGAGGVPESIRSALEPLLRNLSGLLAASPVGF
jgi:hypothetical protein